MGIKKTIEQSKDELIMLVERKFNVRLSNVKLSRTRLVADVE